MEQGAALAAYVWGYRSAMIVSSSGTIALSTWIGWHGAVLSMAAIMAFAPLLSFFSPEPIVAAPKAVIGLLASIRASFVDPLLDFLSRPGAVLLLAFIVLFWVGKVLADNTAASFYHNGIGLSPRAIAWSQSWPQLVGVYFGAALGAWFVARWGASRAVLVAGSLQAASLGLYLLLLAVGTSWMLYLKVGGEYFFNAAAQTAFLSFVSALCSRNYTATQYALLSSAAAIAFHTLGGSAGYMAEALGWAPFYAFTILAGLPALGILLWLRRMAE
jgi:PAT family beta-lactamase induction signal transducer AmpG